MLSVITNKRAADPLGALILGSLQCRTAKNIVFIHMTSGLFSCYFFVLLLAMTDFAMWGGELSTLFILLIG